MTEEHDIEEEKPYQTYEEKIQNLLNRVNKGDVIYPKEEIHHIRQKITDHGVKGAILQVFNESVGDYTLNEEDTEESSRINDSPYFKVNIPSNYPDSDRYWEALIPRLRNIGTGTTNPSGSSTYSIGSTGEGKERVHIQLVRNDVQENRPGLYMKWDDFSVMNEDEAISILEKVGLGIESVVSVGDGVIIEAIP